MKTALITGVSGQDGSYLAELLLNKGYIVVGTHRYLLVKKYDQNNINTYFKNIGSLIENKNFKLEYGDILEPMSICKLIYKYKPNEIYNLAAQSHVNLSFDSSEITSKINGFGVLSLLNLIIDIDPNIKFFQASSSDMYGENNLTIVNEQSTFKPNTPYGCSKLFAHNLVNTYRKTYNIHASCGILFNHESPRKGYNFATQKIARSVARIKLGLDNKLLLGNLDLKKDWGHAREYVEAMWLILQHNKPNDYIISSGKPYSLRLFVEKIFEYAQLDIYKYLEIDKKFYRHYEQNNIIGDASKINKELGWSSKVNLDDMVIEMYEHALSKF